MTTVPKSQWNTKSSSLTMNKITSTKRSHWGAATVYHEIAILPQFLAIEPHFVRKGSDWTRPIAILCPFLVIEPNFVRKGFNWTPEITILPQFLAIKPHFVRKGSNWTRQIAIYFSFWRSNLISCERVPIGQDKSQFYFIVSGDRTSFRAKGFRLDKTNHNFTSVFGDQTSFRAKRLRLDARNRNFMSVFGDWT